MSDDLVVLCALVACSRSIEWVAVERIVARTPEYMTRTASGDRHQPMGERRVRKALKGLMDEALAQRREVPRHLFSPTGAGKARVARQVDAS